MFGWLLLRRRCVYEADAYPMRHVIRVRQLRSRQRPLPEETEWLCNALRTKNRMIAYREARN
eukprot:21658-Eustigmatos_ZCMA.PRE.1